MLEGFDFVSCLVGAFFTSFLIYLVRTLAEISPKDDEGKEK